MDSWRKILSLSPSQQPEMKLETELLEANKSKRIVIVIAIVG